MPYIGKNPKFDSTILKDNAADSVANPASGSDKLVNRNGSLFVKDSAGTETEIAELPIVLSSGQDVSGVLPVANGGTGEVTSTGTNAIVKQQSPTLVTPNLGTPSAATLTNASGLPIDGGTTGTLPVARGGTGQTTAANAFDALAPTTTKGDLIASNGTNNARLAVGADGLILKADSTTATGLAWGSAAAGTGEVNYIENPDAESNTDGWATYADAAGTTPVDGTGGSPTVTWTRQSSVVLRGNQTFKLTKDAANRQGEGASYDFTIKEQDVSKKLKIQFDFKTNEDAAYEAGDLTVYIYDVTNSTLITPVDTSIIDGQNIYQTSFNSTTSTSYRLIFHIATTNASAWDAYIDNVIVGPGMTSQGAAIGPTERYIPVIGDFNNATGLTVDFDSTLDYQRVGDRLYITYSFRFDGTGTDAGTFSFAVGTWLSNQLGVTIDYAKSQLWTPANVIKNGTGGTPVMGAYNNSGILNWVSDNEAGSAIDGDVVGNTAGRYETFTGNLILPIVEWAGKGIVPMLAEDNLSEWQSFTPGSFSGTVPSSTLTLVRSNYRRSGDILKAKITYAVEAFNYSGSAQASSTVFIDRITPDGLTVASEINTDGRSGFGKVRAFLSGSGNAAGYASGFIEYSLSGSAYRFLMNTKDNGTSSSSNNPLLWGDFGNVSSGAVNGFLTLEFDVPIAEWAGSQNSLVGYSLATQNQTGLVDVDNTDCAVNGGTYTPTVTNGTNTTGSLTGDVCMYMRVGNIVSVNGSVQFQASAASTLTAVEFDLPIPRASNFSASTNASGVAVRITTATFTGNIFAVSSTQRVKLEMSSADNSTPRSYRFNLMYQLS